MVVRRQLRAPKSELIDQLGPPLPTLSDESCPLCGRKMIPGPTVDEHHLIPRSQGGKEKFLVHKVCHKKIHRVFSEKELKRVYHTWESLQTHPEMAIFIAWVQKRPIDYVER
ncbi:HNH endonuclease [Polynucleobacter sp. MWH-Loch1C5]|uniref:HNH endonuclease n=1 Tax=Polynucleobacter sp. MWH-Loch1C5 TaxID=2689108 RepID=UPI001C0D3CE0|nr:HNH endonuclease [Polynucleobacter sp. MWH-Loch1C5]MBU3543226.1 HNH endonuclease [Polynucleobacter sp. MWH-Loch1C5]